MVTEIAQIDIKPGMEAEFESGVQKAAPLFKRAKGCRSMDLQRSIEKPARFRLFVGWETVENHTNDFRGSADFQEWRDQQERIARRYALWDAGKRLEPPSYGPGKPAHRFMKCHCGEVFDMHGPGEVLVHVPHISAVERASLP